MTNHWIDLRNSDCILVMGSNAASNHPISFKWITEAMKRGGKLISVDPRFTQTSSKADFYAALRSGTDIAFLGGMMKYILENNKYFTEYVTEYTNAPFIVAEGFSFNDGLFSGYDAKTHKYDKATWTFVKDDKGIPKMDRTLQDPRCVFQLLKKHYSRYDLDTVSAITGTPKEDLQTVYEMYSATGQPGKAGTIMYAMGWTQHTVGVQNIRTMCIIQLLLGNMGVAGGGVNALRGESNVQGSTDQGILFHILPGYLKTPPASQPTLADYNEKSTPKTTDPLSANWWGNYSKYSVSLLKSFWGDKATKENDFGYNWLPKIDDGKPYTWLDIFDEMYKGQFKGFFAWGQNPAASGANANKTRAAMAKLDWMVNVNIFDNETGSFWKGPGMDPKKIKTEVFMLPCSVSVEKEGSISNSGRWMQWRYKAVNPPGKAWSDGDILIHLGNKLKSLYKADKNAVFPEPILNLKWDYAKKDGEFDAHAMAKEINGYFLKDITIGEQSFKKGDLVPGFALLQNDGSTSSGNWLYCNSYTNSGNMAARREREKSGIGLNPKWAWCWPVNRRIIYNRASVDKYGKPWDKERPVVAWDPTAGGGKGGWVGDVPDGPWPPMLNADGTPNPASKYPFIMKPDGHAALFGPGLADGPFSEHYEPMECPVEKNLLSSQRVNPVAPTYSTDMDIYKSCDPKFPFVGSTYRVCEHWQSGVMTRWQPWLIEAQPQIFVEMSHELAKLRGIKNGDKVIVESARGKLEAVAMVTVRWKPFQVQGTTVHEVGLPWHYGWVHPKDGGESANVLTPSTGDPNTRIPESKAFMVNVRKA
jgi:formate dehydrogenase major subunit